MEITKKIITMITALAMVITMSAVVTTGQADAAAKGKYKLGEFLIGEIKKDEGPEYISYKFSFCG